MTLRSNPIAAITDMFKEAFDRDTLETILYTGVGLGGTLAGTQLIAGKEGLIPAAGESAIGRILTSVGVSVLGAGVTGMFIDKKAATRFLVGGLLGTFLQGLGALIPATSDARKWIPTVGMGQDAETAEFRRAIENEVLKELRGGGMSEYIQPAGTEQYIPAAGSEAYLTEHEAEVATGMGAYLTEHEAEVATGMPTGMMDYDPIGSGGNSRERF
jgi:hypothetical protein